MSGPVSGTEASLARPPMPAPAARSLGWAMLFLMSAFLVNVVLTFWFGWPGIAPAVGWEPGPADGSPNDFTLIRSWLQLALYPVAAAAGVFRATATPARTLREDARRIGDANQFLIRAAFWAVFLVGLADAAVSFLRVEGFLPGLVGEAMTSDLGKSSWRGLYVHVPAVALGVAIAAATRGLGFIWLALLVVVAELGIVFSRFVFSYEQSFMGDLVRFWYAALFLFASAYTLHRDGHVRVDVLYAGMGRALRGRVNAAGAILLGVALCWTVLLLGMWSKTAVIVSPILVFETTQSGFGMYVKYFMAGFLGVFAVSMLIQFVSLYFEATADARNEEGVEKGARETAPQIN